MIVKAHRDGTFYVANNGNWRLAGPFSSNDEAWEWIGLHRADHAIEPKNPITPRLLVRNKRSIASFTKEDVLSLVPVVMSDPKSTVREREFALGMETKAKRARPLKITEPQDRWWLSIAKKYDANNNTKCGSNP